MSYFVSRQRYYYSRQNIVEVTSGGLDYAGADMLVASFADEGKDFADPREAVEAAISVCVAWRITWRVAPKETRGPFPKVAFGCTGGMGMELEGGTFKEAREAASNAWRHLDKCAHCGDVLPSKRKRFRLVDSPFDDEFCSEHCAERAQEENEKANAEA
jgi:hypothetical protein